MWHAERRQEDERKNRDEQTCDQLPADVCADNRFQIHHDAGEADMVRAGDDREKAAAETVAVDHDVERQKDGTRATRGDLEDAHGIGEGCCANVTNGSVKLDVPQPVRERCRQVGSGEIIRKVGAKRGLLSDEC